MKFKDSMTPFTFILTAKNTCSKCKFKIEKMNFLSTERVNVFKTQKLVLKFIGFKQEMRGHNHSQFLLLAQSGLLKHYI